MRDGQDKTNGSRPDPASTGKRSVFLRIITVGVIMGISALAFLGIAELYLRVTYAEGLSFGNHTGPYVRRFERDFQFNRFDGPSRGPEVAGPKSASGPRVLIQGDSITWGQGVKDESALFSSQLRDRLRSVRPDSEVAVLAKPGREIDGHLEQLKKWVEEIDPDIIVYQWYINDIELDKRDRPGAERGWRRFVFPRFVNNRSYLWYLLDYRIGILEVRDSYSDYINEYFGSDTEGWRVFTEYFRNWATEAKRHTPNVLIILYPHILPTGVQLGEFHDRLRALAEQEGIMVLDLRQPLEVFSEDWTQIFASSFDGHPNEAAHERIAEALYDRMRALWPDVLQYVEQHEGKSATQAGEKVGRGQASRPAPMIGADAVNQP